MVAVFHELQTEILKQSRLAQSIFWAREVEGLLRGALHEHLRTFAGSRHASPLFSTRLTMRSEFRFSKAIPALMTIILAAVVMAIEKATAIQNSIPPSSPHVGPIQPAHFTFLPTLVLILALAGVGASWAGRYFLLCTVQDCIESQTLTLRGKWAPGVDCRREGIDTDCSMDADDGCSDTRVDARGLLFL
jgi:hypothetical protein